MKNILNIILTNIINSFGISDGDDIKDIKEIIVYDFKYQYLLILLAVIVLSLIIIFMLKKKKNIQKEEKPVLLPKAIALDKINKLRESQLIEQGKYKEFYTILTDIIRVFLEGQYQISAMDQTTYELVYEIKNKNIISGKVAMLQDFLSNCDLVKFAKQIPLKENSDKMIDIAVEIINIAKDEHIEIQSEIKINV